MFLAMFYFIWNAIYENSSSQTINNYSLNEIVTYYIVSMLIGHFIYNAVSVKIQEKVMLGDLNPDLLKPYSILSQYFSIEVAERSFALIFEVLPVLIISFFLFGLQIPSLFAIFLFSIGLINAFLLNFLLSFLLGLLAFYTKDIRAVQWLFHVAIRFLSGEFIPLEFFHAYFSFAQYLPFYYIRYGLIQIFLEKEGAWIILAQIFWIMFFYVIVKIAWKISMKRYGAVGG